jgi:hypothetical protein
VSNLINEILLRLLKLCLGVALGAIVYVVAVALLGVPASFEVAALSFLCGGMSILLVQESPL